MKYICYFEFNPEDTDKIMKKWLKREEERKKDPEVDAQYTKVIFPPHQTGYCEGFSVDEATPTQLLNTTMFWFPEVRVNFMPIYDMEKVTELYLKSKE